MTSADTWDPAQYDRFQAERTQPFRDLLTLVRPVAGGRVVDLGCGTGALTRDLHRTVGAAATLGIDRSAAMLAEASPLAGDGLRFEEGDIGAWTGSGYDVVFANASLQWVPGHHGLLQRLHDALAPGGQLAVQVPSNYDHPSHTVAAQVGARFGAAPSDRNGAVLTPEAYAETLERLGFAEQHVRLQVYGHRMTATSDVIEWVKGTLLTEYRAQLGEERFPEFLDAFRHELLTSLGDPAGTAPYFYAFKRILFWAKRP
jgi:trans-aconitate 2-methyltransferase